MNTSLKRLFSNIKYGRKYAFEFLSIFIAVVAAFALDNWNDNRKDRAAETKILAEISNGLEKDLIDVDLNSGGHALGKQSILYWRDLLNDTPRNLDSIEQYYHLLIRDFISIQNVSGYETLKSRGLELIQNDDLRFEIISLYAYDYDALRKLEEEYNEMQFFQTFFDKINPVIAPHLQFDDKGKITGIDFPLTLTQNEKKILMSYLWKLEVNRDFILGYYKSISTKIKSLKSKIDQ